MRVYFLAIWMKRVFKIFNGLIKDSNGRNKPDNYFAFIVINESKMLLQSITCDKRFAACSGNFNTNMRNAWYIIFVWFDSSPGKGKGVLGCVVQKYKTNPSGLLFPVIFRETAQGQQWYPVGIFLVP
jgi:hypothetical protein